MVSVNDAKLILFDIDCTLLWTRGAGREAMRYAMLEIYGTNAGIDQHTFGGKTDWQCLSELLTPQGFTPQQIEARMAEYDVAMGRHLATVIRDFEVTACPAALELVDELHHRPDTHLALVTGNCRSSAPVKLQAVGINPALFPVGAYGSEALERDHLPPLAVARAIDHYRQQYAPQQVIVVGDTPADVQCARAIGAVAVAVRTGFCQPGELETSAPDVILDDLTTFSAYL